MTEPQGISRDLLTLMGSVVMWWGRIEALLVTDVIGLNIREDVSKDKRCWPPQIATKRLIEQWLVVLDTPRTGR